MEKSKLSSDSEQELRLSAKKYADSAGIKLNPDKKIVDTIIEGLMRNKEKNGDIYCPCRFITKNKKKDEEIVCPCVYHRGEIELQKHCHCNLFVK